LLCGRRVADEDEDVFLDFREQGAANAMHACYTVQPAHFFGVLGGIMEHAGDGGWQSVESVVFATRCVGMEVKRRLRGLGAVTRTASAATDASTAGTIASARSELEATNSFLRNLFNA
jgi:sorbitol-specific phosphotransferase system component IIA